MTDLAPLTIQVGPERFSLARGSWSLDATLDALPGWLNFHRWLARRRPHEAYRKSDVQLIENAMRGAGMPVPPETKGARK